MTSPTNPRILVPMNGPPLHVCSCDECFAMVPIENWDNHATWHESLAMSLVQAREDWQAAVDTVKELTEVVTMEVEWMNSGGDHMRSEQVTRAVSMATLRALGSLTDAVGELLITAEGRR